MELSYLVSKCEKVVFVDSKYSTWKETRFKSKLFNKKD